MEKYQYSQEELSMIEQSCIPFAIYQFIDKRVVTLAVSAGFCELFNLDKSEAVALMDTDMYRDVHPNDVARAANDALLFATEDVPLSSVYRSKKDGKYMIVHSYGKHIYPEPGVKLAVVWYTDEGFYSEDSFLNETILNHDYSVKIHEADMSYESNYDSMTGLPSMTYFFKLAAAGKESMLQKGEDPALIYADLNGMTYYNRRYGFSEGGVLIKEFAKLLAKYFSTENCSRFGADHFAAFANADGLDAILDNLIEDCKYLNNGRTLPVKIGVYRHSMGAVEASLACDRAKYACNLRRDTLASYYIFYDESMLSKEASRQYILSNFKRALNENWIQAYYQPIVRAANGRVCDEEALARWIDPEKGFLSPGDFIPILEEAKLIYKVDLRMVDLILAKMKTQKEEGLYVVPISVNLSRTDFDCCDIVEEVRRRVDEAGISRDKLTIEITESTLGEDFDFMKQQIEKFQELGFPVWMDDFGSGYSSLDVLQDIRFDLIKLDMRFMRQFNKGNKSKIILTELIKMTAALGIDTVTEGVETAEQVAFLREIGCTKLQGYYYCKPISLEKILERYRTGTQIGFENPEESAYFASIGRVNLYDLAVVSNKDSQDFQHYFDTMPMAVLETDTNHIQITRCNRTFRDFMEQYFEEFSYNGERLFSPEENDLGFSFVKAINECATKEERVFIKENIDEQTIVHAFVRRISVNPVTGVTACAFVVLGTLADVTQGVSYAHIAQALSADYFHLFYVNLETESFIEFRPDTVSGKIYEERHGKDFFSQSRKDANVLIYKDDRARFIEFFHKEKIIEALKETGSYSIYYRQLVDSIPTYVNMKIVQMTTDKKYIIIGVNNMDSQIRHQQTLDRVKNEQITYERVTALAGNFVCIYTVDPNTDHYREFSADKIFKKLNLAPEGEDFFQVAYDKGIGLIYEDDYHKFKTMLTKENIMRCADKGEVFNLNYRVVLDGELKKINIKAAVVIEVDGPQIVIGVSMR